MKELVMEVTKEVTEELPDSATTAEIIDEIVLRLSALKGFEEIEDGKYTLQEELLEEIKRW